MTLSLIKKYYPTPKKLEKGIRIAYCRVWVDATTKGYTEEVWDMIKSYTRMVDLGRKLGIHEDEILNFKEDETNLHPYEQMYCILFPESRQLTTT